MIVLRRAAEPGADQPTRPSRDGEPRDRPSSTTASRWSTSPRASSSIRRPGTAATRWSTCSASCSAAASRERPGIVHRLDKDTSGLMLVARDDEAHRRLAAMIKRREVDRAYLALVEGRPRSRSGTIDAPLGRDHRAPERRAVRGRGAREARTHFEVRRGAAGRHPGRGAARDRSHAPDPRPLRRDRPPGRRRSALRPRRPPRPRAPVPAQRAARLRRTRSAARSWSSSPSCPRTSLARSSARAAPRGAEGVSS